MLRRTCILLLLTVLPGGLRAALPKEAAPLRDAFETSLSGLDSERAAQLKQLGADYEVGLRKLRGELEEAGRLRPLLAVHDELARFSKTRDPAGPGADSVELATLQSAYLSRSQQVAYSNDLEVIRLAERYVQALAELRAGLLKAKAEEAVKGVDEERDRLLSLGRLRSALRATLTNPPAEPNGSSGSATNGLAAGKARTLRMYRLANEDVAKVMGYTMSLSLLEDSSRLKVRESEAGMTTTRSEDGPVIYTPRITIASRNSEIPPDCDMTIDYYTRSFTDNGYRKESSETLPLPRVARGESATVEGRGLSLWRSISVTHTGRGADTRSYSGSELYGMAVTIRDSRNEVVLLRFTPQTLARDLGGE